MNRLRTNLDIENIIKQNPYKVFDDRIIIFLSNLSDRIIKLNTINKYPDLLSFAFFIRKRNLFKLKKEYLENQKSLYLGLGLAFHIAPSNVPLNFAYSLVAALICGNPSVVRISSKRFEQAEILICAINEELKSMVYPKMFTLVQYDHDDKLNEYLSKSSRIRLLWGGNETINIFKKFLVQPNVIDITFPNRYSITLIDANYYNNSCEPKIVAQKFYNDVYTFDQNACTSPRAIFWLGEEKIVKLAKIKFWNEMKNCILKNNYTSSQGVGVRHFKISAKYAATNLVTFCGDQSGKGMNVYDVNSFSKEIFDFHPGEGLFFQIHLNSLESLKKFITDECQTLSVLMNDKKLIMHWLEKSCLKGIDRVCNVGASSNFSLNWDGKNLFYYMTRKFQI